MNTAWARLGAVEDRPAAPDTVAVAENLQALGASAVAAVKDKTMGVDDRRWTHPFGVGPDRRARTGAGPAEDALGRLIVTLALFRRLKPLGALVPARH